MTVRTRVVLVVGIVVGLVVAALLPRAAPSTSVAAVGAGLAPAGAPTTWYCAEGTANPGGRAGEDVVVGNVGRGPLRAVISVDGGAEVAPVSRSYTVAPGRVARVPVASIAPIADPGVVVETTGGRAAVEHRITNGSDTALGPCARAPSPVTRFAAGTTAKGAELWLALFNPYPDDAIVDVSALTENGVREPGRLQGVVVPHTSRVTLALHVALPRVDTVATQVAVRRGRTIAEISQHLDGTDGRKGIALSLGAASARTWRFPIGLNGSGHHERLVLANPSSHDATVTVRSALDAAAAVEPDHLVVPAASVVTADLSRIPPDIGFSLTVVASQPIVAELVGASGPPQPADVQGIASDLGITEGAREWAVVPTRLDTKSTDVVAVVSADGRRHRVTLRRAGAPGRTRFGSVAVPAAGRAMIDLAELVPGTDIALLLKADGPVVVERESTRPGLTRSHAIPG
ncbi:MAG: DUF5719 family protein [Acidimicrobiia bacterium]